MNALDYARNEGLEKGLEQGLEKGKAALLGGLLTHKFGPLPAGMQQRLASASARDLDAWALNLLNAQRPEDVFRC